MPIKKIIIIGQFAVILFMIRNCHVQDLIIDKNGVQLKLYENKVDEFSSTINKYGNEIASQKQVITDRNKELEKKLLENSNLSKLNEQIKYQSQTKIKNLLAEYSNNNKEKEVILLHDTIVKNGDTTIITGVPLGTKFSVKDTADWYSLDGSLDKKGIKIDSMSFKSEVEINIGLEKQKGYKGWLLGKQEPKVEVISKNPYTNLTGMQNIKFEDKKWYNNGWVKFGFGVLLGGLLIK